MKCQEDLRTACLYNSFGIVTILQGEILSVYKYLNDTSVDEKVEIRACNALTDHPLPRYESRSRSVRY